MEGRNVSIFLLVISAVIYNCMGQVGQIEVALKEILRCDDVGTDDISFTTTRMTRVSRNAVNYFTNYTLRIPLDDSLSAVTDLQAWGNGGWRPGFFTLDTPHICAGGKKLNPTWFYEVIKSTGQEDCPIPPGTYELKAYNVSFAEFNVPMFSYGKYRIINQFFKDEVKVGCIGMVLDMTPKRKEGSKKKH